MKGRELLGKGILGVVIGVMLMLLLVSSAWAADEAAPAVIEQFVADSPVVKCGQTTKLNWKVTGASRVDLIGIEKDPEVNLPLEGSLEVWPMTTTSYILIAYGKDGLQVSKSFTVNVDVKGDVKIESFKAAVTQVLPYQTVLLSWKVLNGLKVRILGISPKDDEAVKPIEGSIDVWPEKTTTYLLEATGLNGEVASAAVTVNVITAPQPKILSFTASKTEVARGEMVTLTWTTENVVGCTLVTNDGIKLPNRPTNGYISLTPNKTRTFTLIAFDASGAETKADLTITVK